MRKKRNIKLEYFLSFHTQWGAWIEYNVRLIYWENNIVETEDRNGF